MPPRTLTFTLLILTLAWGCEPAPERNVSEIPSPAPEGSRLPHLAVAPDGRTYLSWVESRPEGGHALRFAMLEGEVWSTPRTIAEGDGWFVNWADFPSIFVHAGGLLAAHWLVRSGPETYAYDVVVSVSDDAGATWSDPVSPHRDATETEHGFVSMWPEADGISLVWLDGRGFAEDALTDQHEMQLRTSALSAEDGLGAEIVLDARVCDCCQTAAAVTSAGPIVFYRDRSGSEVRDISYVRRIGQSWTAPANLYPDGWQIAGCPVNGPAAAARGETVAVAWYTAPGDEPRVQLAWSTDGGDRFQAPSRVDGGQPLGRVGVALDDSHALVVWLESAGDERAAVMGRFVSTDGEAGSAFSIAAAQAARASGFPRVVRTGTDFVVAWTDAAEGGGVRLARISREVAR